MSNPDDIAQMTRLGIDPAEFSEDGAYADAADGAETLPPTPVLAVVGRPNVGKSTLVNRLLGRREAVVQDIPGVTRDRVAYDALWNGRRFTIVDTGGWEPDATGLQAAVAAQADLAMQTADAVLLVVDAAWAPRPPTRPSPACCAAPTGPCCSPQPRSTTTGSPRTTAALWRLGLGEPHPVSGLHGRGTGDLLDAVLDALPESPRERSTPAPAGRVGSRSSASRTSASPAC